MTTARRHFDEDITRAEAVLAHARSQEQASSPARLIGDIRLSAVAMAVGALDAYFCDAYVDCLTSVLHAYVTSQWVGDLPSSYAKKELPAGVVLDASRPHRPLWSLRMAARTVMERDNVLSVTRVPDLFNGNLAGSHKLWLGVIDQLIALGYKRFTGCYPADIEALSGKALGKAKKKAIATFQERIKSTVQYRHDWAHNLGRPRLAIVDLTHGRACARVRQHACGDPTRSDRLPPVGHC